MLIGSFLHITQTCKKCLQTRVWDSQPYIGGIPADYNYYVSSILFVGAFPGQALQLFNVLNCPAISWRTFFHHQSHYLQPAIYSVWKIHQEQLIAKFKFEQKPLVLAGDGRCGSPGYSAKFGSYSELSCNKVLDFQLVQVCNIIIIHYLITCVLYFRAVRLVEVTTWRKRAFIDF